MTAITTCEIEYSRILEFLRLADLSTVKEKFVKEFLSKKTYYMCLFRCKKIFKSSNVILYRTIRTYCYTVQYICVVVKSSLMQDMYIYS